MSMSAAVSGGASGPTSTVRLAKREVANEDDQIEEGREEDRVAQDREQHRERA